MPGERPQPRGFLVQQRSSTLPARPRHALGEHSARVLAAELDIDEGRLQALRERAII
jgi:hypothetical protein